MNNYHLEQPVKTKFLNFFRKVFTFPFFEKLLVEKTISNPSPLLKKIIPANYLFSKGTNRSVTRDGINLNLDISNVVDHYLYFGLTDSHYDSVLEDIKKSKVIFDIGANIGATALYFAHINPDAEVYACEPHPDTYKKARENLQLNDCKNITLMNIGLGEQRESLKLYEVNKNNPGMNRIIAEEKDLPFKKIEIDILDRICAEKNISQINFIKLDVEGFEYSVLMGGKDILQRSKPTLFIELDDNNLKENNKSAKELVSLISSFGYEEIYRADTLKPIVTGSNFDNCHYDIIAK